MRPAAPIPQQVKVRIPASAGEPFAVASPQPGSETAPVNQWTELIAQKKVTTTRSGDWIEVTFTPLSRLFNIEFYDKISTVTFDRRYTLTWPGDLTADAVTVNLREPFGATDFQSTPALPLGVTDEEGLVAHRLEVGALEAGRSFVFSIGYHREDKRTSAEALQLATPAPTPKPAPLPVAQGGNTVAAHRGARRGAGSHYRRRRLVCSLDNRRGHSAPTNRRRSARVGAACGHHAPHARGLARQPRSRWKRLKPRPAFARNVASRCNPMTLSARAAERA